MLYPEGTVPKTPRELKDLIMVAMMCVPKGKFPTSMITGKPYYDFDGIFQSMTVGLENLRKRFGSDKADQLQDMLSQARAHYAAGDGRLGGALLEDTKMVAMDRQAWAYPEELYRWPRDPSLPDVSEADMLNKE
jgi:hypothetical protein